MTLLWLILIPFAGGFLCWLTERDQSRVPRWIALASMTLVLGLALQLWFSGDYSLPQTA
ncbi:MAG TPA: NADH-quinone oxidoreductase subunit M, partial [Plesiomonas shigelloides]|nr:NADH-quinone oxidoreductase subunit M [Plesiomonas shigelloides]